MVKYINAHIIRRHTHTSDLYMSVSPIHEHYRNETEKLHNEIKNLKERLNETEKVIRNESERICDKKILNYNKKQTENEIENLKYDNNKSKEHLEYKEYQEEIKNLKIMLFDEIHNLRQKENIMYERTSEINVQALISQQEKEFQKLKNQLLDKFTPDIESMHTKLYDQENYWKSKIEQLENQHHKDIERLTIELKLTQNAADDMKAKYEAKVNDLERQTANQSNILIEQSKQLHSLSHEINISQLNERNKDLKNNSLQKCSPSIILDNEISKKSDENNLKQNCVDATIEQIITENNIIDTTITSNLSSKVFPLTEDTQILNSKNKFIIHENKRNIKQKYEKIPDIENFNHIKTIKKDLEYYSSSNISDLEDSMLEEENNSKHKKYNESIIKMDLHKPDISKLENVINKNTSNDFLSDIKNIKTLKSIEENLSSVTNSESFISNSSIENDITIYNDSSLHEYKTQLPFSLKSKKITEHNYKSLQASLMDVFEQKLKDLGIDPEWQGIPKTTFKQKMDILKHHHKLAVKKLPKYHQIKLRIIEEVLNKISRKEKITENIKQFKKPSLHRPIIKELSNQQNPDSHISTLQAITLNEYYSTPEIKDSVKNITENESLPIKTQIANYKTIEELIDISPNSIKSLESIQDATNLQEFLIKKDFLNEMKPVFNSETFKVISNNKTISSYKSIENNDINNSDIQQELQNIFISPKHNKSVLKSTTGSTNSLIKKKVIFDLTNKKDKESYSDDDKEKKELYENNWNTLSNSDEQKYLSQLEDHKNSSNIILKTAQSDKIAELSKKLEIQLNMVRQKPIGSVETIFSSKYIQNKKNQNKSIEQINPTSISSFVINPVQTSLSYSKKPNDLLPQSASYNLTDKISEILHAESVSEISDLDSDIDKILKLE
ncbi:repetitive organellar protein isoform X4 [Apis cerana]|uniref:repetitive organellar protein isoform X4 n=1 Tax=Apis cerana TaxID=7461 RepID=UPI002B232E5D|nr:repetitive organellar protein isoform X4 [Apis cerana]